MYQQVLDVLRAALGGLHELNSYLDQGDWWFAAQHRGREVHVGLAGDGGRVTGLTYAAPLVPRTLQCNIEGTYVSHLTLPRVQTGDPEFDARAHVHGAPPEIVQAALDGPTRRWILDTHVPPRPPQITTDHGFLGIYRCYRRTTRLLEIPPLEMPDAAEIARWLDAALGLADRLNGAFDATYQGLQAQQGRAAAERWLAEQHAAADQLARKRTTVRWIVFGAVAALFVLPLLAMLVIALLLLLSG
ncbi:MAG: hypothetical protein HY744_26435 [Deltaproteobacteria bacterium]|nr:hypothetical protein [Deltaproteobacteria bacterium]